MKTRLLIIIGVSMMVTIPLATYSVLDWHDVYYGFSTDTSLDIDISPKTWFE